MENGVVEEIEPNQSIFSKQEIRKSLSLKDLVSTIRSFRFKLEPLGSHHPIHRVYTTFWRTGFLKGV